MMDFQRAREIVNSDSTFEVFYYGTPVWIEQLDADNQTALVASDELPAGKSTVSIDELTEG